MTAILAITIAAASIATVGVGSAGAAVPGKAGGAATLTVQAPEVTILSKGSSKFVKAKNAQKVRTGDTVQTGPAGLAEITFPDGSLTRLDHNTVFTLDKLVTKTGRREVVGTVNAGQTWNRVQKLSENERFDQGNGNGATAAVLGTAFVTKCEFPPGTVAFKAVKTKKALKKLRRSSKKCNFTLIDGKLQLTALNKSLEVNRGQQVDTSGGEAADPATFPPDILFTNQWIVRNLGADAVAGVAEATGQPTADDLKYARIEGSWPVTLTVVSSDGFRNLGSSFGRTYTFTADCSGGACRVTLSRETANGTRVIPLTYANGVYSGTDPDLGVQDCILDNGTVSVPGGIRNSGTIQFAPTSAVARNGLWVANQLAGTVTETATQIAGGPGQCGTGTATFALAASR